ncbi:hypothetical protein AX15_006429 [Amanita polypyramis BW_CC]|nr:hypothetical protein AX15_006429 [Amanita polypyramis BW_CC]
MKMSMEWLANEFEKAGTDLKFAAQQATARVESVASSKHTSRAPTPAVSIMTKQSPKPKLRSADVIIRSHPITPENQNIVNIKMPTPKCINDCLQSIASDITSLEYIDEIPKIKEELSSPKDLVMDSVIPDNNTLRTILTRVSPPPVTKGEEKMDTSADFIPETSATVLTAPSSSMIDTPQSSSSKAPPPSALKKNKGKGQQRAESTPLQQLLDPKSLIDFM